MSSLSAEVKQYLVITGNYWAFTLTDGALRMLVLLHFHQLGYTPLELALLFLFYEFFGVVTNLAGGWLGAHLGLNRTMNAGLLLQIAALGLLLVPPQYLTVLLVMCAQALSGIAKDLNKMSAKSAIKLLIPENQHQQLFKWVAILTGSKNALKGVGFFLGAALLSVLGFWLTVLCMALMLTLVWVMSRLLLKKELGKSTFKPKFTDLISKSSAINWLSAARLCLFASRDVWFVIALPVFLSSQLNWDFWAIGAFMALWIIGYGLVQSLAPKFIRRSEYPISGGQASAYALVLALLPLALAGLFFFRQPEQWILMVGLAAFGVVFAINSSVHSFLIVHHARADGVSLDVGFYYMANASGRLLGTLLSGWIFQAFGIAACLFASFLLVLSSAIAVNFLGKP